MLVGAFAVTNLASHPATTIMAASYSHCRCHHGGKAEDYRRIQKIRLALISFDDSAIRCKTREITARGAILAVADPLDVPDVFDIVIPSEQLVKRCEVLWRDSRRLDVSFK